MSNASNMSSITTIGVAPSCINLLVPILNMLLIFPGTAKTSRPCSKAYSAVINEPLLRLASTITTVSDKPLIILLRRGK